MRGALIGGIEDRNAAASLAAVAREALEPEALQDWEDVLSGAICWRSPPASRCPPSTSTSQTTR